MEKMNVAAKAGLNQDKLDELFDRIWDRDYGTGTTGYRFEKTVAHLISAKGIVDEDMAANGQVDRIVYVKDGQGKLHGLRIEIKTGCGIVAQLPCLLGDSIDNYGPSDVYPKAHLIIYAARAEEFEDIDELLDETVVLTIPDWVEMMVQTAGKRKHSFGTAFKLGVNNNATRAKNEAIPARPVLDKKGRPVLDEDGNVKMTKRGIDRYTDCITIQEAYRQQFAEALQENAETHQYRTLGEWLEEIGRA